MYAKIFTQIFDSSIAKNWKTRHVFEDLLKLADVDGVVEMTREAIAARTGVPLLMVTEAITALEKPDPESKTPDDEGRRLKRLDKHRTWGWRIVNYQKYRAIRNEESRREYRQQWMAEKREENPQYGRKYPPVNTGEHAVNSGERGEPMQKQREMQREGEGKPPKSVSHLSILDIKDVITAKKEKAQEIKRKYASEVAMGTHWSDDEKRKEHRSLRVQIKALETELSNRA